MQQERLRALGQMAGGIAHDINNSILPISLYAESLVEQETQLSAPGRERLKTIGRAIDDVAHTVARMREFCRAREPQMQAAPLCLNVVAEQVLDMTRARWRDMPQAKGVVLKLETALEAGIPDVNGAESEIRDALTNLIFNAADAMPEGGVLSVRTRTAPQRSALHVLIEVQDTGIGMDEETRKRCLEPFYTTKGERGTGLGLAMVYGMVRRHDAEIEIESEPGKGTTVRLIFAASVAENRVPEPEHTPPAARQFIRVLLVDDDPMVLQALRDALTRDGQSVTVAGDGQAGIEAFIGAQSRGEPFSVVVTDLGMPRVDGHRVAAAVKAASASTPVIMLTGWGQRLDPEDDMPPHVDLVLAKPPKIRALRAAVAELAARGETGGN
jgi:CheY-like chemotaxis protein